MPRARPSLVLLPILLAVAVLGLSACAAGRGNRPTESEGGEAIYVVSNGWHTGVVVEGGRIPSARWPQRDALGGRRYVEVGWGDRDAYLADRLTTRLALRAAFASRGSVLLVAGFDEPVPERFRGIDVVELGISADALDGLSAFIEASHAPDDAGEPVPLAPGWGPSWTFYVARGRFHILNTCNSWTARALRAAGLPLRPALTLTAYHLMQQVRPLGRRVLTGPA
ncbi:MAG TPA: DUF2459 domain-containing protein [Methylomirabilota bacterium]|jgi:uncharacterized protein (TIGR02117 family)|nr:DUF2459 domain-containing protein [Methylomirabilota bacterium]